MQFPGTMLCSTDAKPHQLELLIHVSHAERVPVLITLLSGFEQSTSLLYSFLIYDQSSWSTCLYHLKAAAVDRAARCCHAVADSHNSHTNIAALLRSRVHNGSHLMYMHSDLWLDTAHAKTLAFVRGRHLTWSLHSIGPERAPPPEWGQPERAPHPLPGRCSFRQAHPFLGSHWNHSSAVRGCQAALQHEPAAQHRLQASVAAGAIDATCCYIWAELIYLPNFVHKRFAELETAFRGVFHEFALGVMLYILDLDHEEGRPGGAPWHTMPCYGGNVASVSFDVARNQSCAHKIDLREAERWYMRPTETLDHHHHHIINTSSSSSSSRVRR